jgi:2-amino-4-hydroxy-6-hydroxymethyldihydropteridine diphosphokinase
MIYILLGSNMGDRAAYLAEAQSRIHEIVPVQRASRIYESAAWGNEAQASFLNQVLEAKPSALSPESLLKACQSIELALGRERKEHWGARCIDIDLLYIGSLQYQSPVLQIPHPYIAQRRFTLLPLCELVPDFIHPTLHKSQSTLLAECSDSLAVWPWEGGLS